MNSKSSRFELYKGKGGARAGESATLPLFEKWTALEDPSGYKADEGLRNAVNVALSLGQPLLLTGEPGTGKTQLAFSVAYELGLSEPLVFNVKTTSSAKDLFYQYDAMHHFHDSHFGKKDTIRVDDYIHYEAFGLAILLAKDPSEVNQFLPSDYRGRGPTRSIVLIDEIDKAPRDLPNDVLNEIEEMSFTVKEMQPQKTFTANECFRPILVLTSNSEKNLPDAFLRRCVFYHIPFPDEQGLREIIERRLPPTSSFTPRMIDNAINEFVRIRRTIGLKKPPATAELLGWIRILSDLEIDMGKLKAGQIESVIMSYSVLAKTSEDLELLQRQAVADVPS
jgi:MoxR-like ATPase